MRGVLLSTTIPLEKAVIPIGLKQQLANMGELLGGELSDLQAQEQPGESVPACLQELLQPETLLQSDGMHCVASWRDLLLQAGRSRGGAGGTDPPNSHDESEGWVRGSQRRAMQARGRAELDSSWHNLNRTSRALLLSQSGPLAGKVLTVIPAVPETALNSSHSEPSYCED